MGWPLGLDAANISLMTTDIHAGMMSGRLEINGEILAELQKLGEGRPSRQNSLKR